MRNRLLLGLSGIRSAGKDTIAGIMIKEHGFSRIAFADPLYTETAAAFGVPVSKLRDRENKEVKQSYLGLSNCTDKDFVCVAQTAGLDMGSNSPRAILQTWGTEYRRWSVYGHDQYWIDKVYDLLASDPISDFIIPDCRFISEVAMVKSLGGYHLRVRRPAIESAWAADEHSQHLSETELLNELVSYEFFNQENFIDGLGSQVISAIDQLRREHTAGSYS